MLLSLIFFWLGLVMAVKHGWLFNSLAAVELLTQFLVRVVVNLAFVSPLSKYEYSFSLCCVCHSFVLSHLQLAAGKEWSEQPQHKTSPVPLPCCTHLEKWLFFLMTNICGKCWCPSCCLGLCAKDTSQPCVGYSLALAVHYCQLFLLQLGRFCPQKEVFSPLQLWGIWIQPSWWSFAMYGWTDTTLMVTTWFLLPKHPE